MEKRQMLLIKQKVYARKIRRFDFVHPRSGVTRWFSFKVKSYAEKSRQTESKSELILSLSLSFSLYSRIWRCNFLKILGTDSQRQWRKKKKGEKKEKTARRNCSRRRRTHGCREGKKRRLEESWTGQKAPVEALPAWGGSEQTAGNGRKNGDKRPLSLSMHHTHVDLVHRTRLNAKSHERVTCERGGGEGGGGGWRGTKEGKGGGGSARDCCVHQFEIRTNTRDSTVIFCYW